MKKTIVLLIAVVLIIIVSSCKDVPPVIPGLTKSEVALFTDPDSATIFFNRQLAGNVSPFIVSDLEPGFYRFDLQRNHYLDTVIYYLLKRNVEDSIFVELREDPKYWWKTYNITNSTLPSNSLSKVRVDKNNNKWIGSTTKGLIKFDGNIFTVYNISNSGIPGNSVNDILIVDNIIWVGTEHGIGRFDGSNWKIYNLSNSQIPDEYITALTIDRDNNIWAGTKSGLLKFDGVSFNAYNQLNSGLTMDIISALAVGPNNVLWAGTSGGGLYKYDNFKWSVFSTYNSDLQNNFISSIRFDNTGILWVGNGSPSTGDVSTGGLSYFKDSKWYNINRYNSRFPGQTANDLVFDIKNNAWIATDAGFVKFDGKNWTVYINSNSGLSGNSVISVSIDSKQNKWCTSDGLSEYIGGN